jgi:hypothetical protein
MSAPPRAGEEPSEQASRAAKLYFRKRNGEKGRQVSQKSSNWPRGKAWEATRRPQGGLKGKRMALEETNGIPGKMNREYRFFGKERHRIH